QAIRQPSDERGEIAPAALFVEPELLRAIGNARGLGPRPLDDELRSGLAAQLVVSRYCPTPRAKPRARARACGACRPASRSAHCRRRSRTRIAGRVRAARAARTSPLRGC